MTRMKVLPRKITKGFSMGYPYYIQPHGRANWGLFKIFKRPDDVYPIGFIRLKTLLERFTTTEYHTMHHWGLEHKQESPAMKINEAASNIMRHTKAYLTDHLMDEEITAYYQGIYNGLVEFLEKNNLYDAYVAEQNKIQPPELVIDERGKKATFKEA